MSDIIAYTLVVAMGLGAVAGVVFALSGVDDLIIDICYLGRALYRSVFILRRYPPLREKDLLDRAEQPIAVMIPAWDESAVIRRMLQNTLASIDYSNYVLFVGTYPNDEPTQQEVDLVKDGGGKVVRITLPHPGPTNKADCLNWLLTGIRKYEAQRQIQFQAFVMQDCEDVIHPLCYRLFNFLIPRKDMVQLPVLSLPRAWHEFTGCHYLDEFSQLHYKDLVVRELLDRSLPAAGVGVAFSRRALTAVARENHNEVFSTRSLTEDYDLGYRLKRLGMRQVFVKFQVDGRLVGVREYFPSTFRAAMRQKSRWVMGIAMQGWAHIGWTRGLCANYMLYRDRKALVTNLATLLGYLVVLVVVSVWTVQWLEPEAYHFPPLVVRGSALWYLLIVNFVLLSLRVLQRAYCVGRLYGPLQALLSLPRMVWANAINFAATVRAIRIYCRYLRTGKAIAWDKTSHQYPSFDELPAPRLVREGID